MRRRLVVVSLIPVMAFALLPSFCRSQQPKKRSASRPVARYATDDFIAGCRVLTKPLYEDPHFGSLPIHRHLPDPVSLRRLHAMQIEELAVFCGPATDGKLNASDRRDLQWAAAARLAKPVELEEVMKRWRESLVPREEEIPNPDPVRLGGFDCFRVPAGTFFPPPRKYGTLRFLDSEGRSAEKGVSVGNAYDFRSYVEGQAKSAAIFTLNGIDEADLIENRLPLEIRLDVFRTYRTGLEFTSAEISLRNPETGLTSEPISIEAKSHVNCRLNFPRRLKATDQDGKNQNVDLLKDLVSLGKLEVVLKGTLRGIYIGVGQFDVNLRRLAFEYICVNDREIVVAESPATLEAMLQTAKKPVALSERLSLPGEFIVAGSVRDEEDRKAFRQLIALIADGPMAGVWSDSVAELTGAVRLDQAETARLTAKFKDRPTAEKAARLGRAKLREVHREVAEIISQAIDRTLVKGNLATIGMDGISFAFPREDSLTGEQADSAYAKRKSELLRVIQDVLDNIRIETDGSKLTILFTRPKSLSNLSEAATNAWAKLDASLAEDLHYREKFDLSDEVFERVTQRIPGESGAWFYRAWQLSYNMPVELDGYATRYAWVRRGIEALLDGAEQNPGSTDMLWMAARFIGHKIGDADDREAYRELFSEDDNLHKRLAKYIDPDKARLSDETIDNWLAAKLLSEECIRRQGKDGASSTILPALFFSRPAMMQARFAESLAHSGRWNESRRAWEEAEELHKELRRIQALDGPVTERVLPPLAADSKEKTTVSPRNFIRYDYWLTRCRLEQTKELQSARKLAHEAARQAKQSESMKAKQGYRRSMKMLAELQKQNPDAISLLYGDLKDIAKGYRQYYSAADDESLAPLLEAIENHDALGNYPLSIEPRGFESILDYLK